MKEQYVDRAKYNQLLDDVRIVRSKVIEFAITIEQIMSEILIDYIGTEHTKDIFQKHLFSDVLDFDKKISLFNALNKKGLLPKPYNDTSVNSKLNYIKLLRNYMAHCGIHMPPGFVDNYNGEFIEFTSFTQRDEHVIVTVYKNAVEEDNKRIFSAELFYETCKSVIKDLLEIHKQLE